MNSIEEIVDSIFNLPSAFKKDVKWCTLGHHNGELIIDGFGPRSKPVGFVYITCCLVKRFDVNELATRDQIYSTVKEFIDNCVKYDLPLEFVKEHQDLPHRTYKQGSYIDLFKDATK